jgi:hypothetical protein
MKHCMGRLWSAFKSEIVSAGNDVANCVFDRIRLLLLLLHLHLSLLGKLALTLNLLLLLQLLLCL